MTQDPSSPPPSSFLNDEEKALHEKLHQVQRQLATIEKREASEKKAENKSRKEDGAMAQGVRMASEFVSGVAAGGILGYLADQLLGTKPWGLIVFLIVGFCAGLFNLYRSALKPSGAGKKID